ncbi:MAG: Rdx family protein [Anaerolineae bacterium]
MPRAVSLADKLLGAYKTAAGEVALVPSSGGAFEVSVNGDKVYSKLETGSFPDERALVRELGGKLGA